MNQDATAKTLATLEALIGEWERWAQGADRSEEGWETNFPRWAALVTACEAAMLAPSPTLPLVERVGFCWALEEENEMLAEFARQALPRTLDLVLLLTRHEAPKTRWQAYDVLGDVTEGAAREALREGIRDPVPYVRRRALLAYAREPQPVSAELVKTALEDPDPYMRRLAFELAERTGDPAIVTETRRALLADEDEVVRAAVKSPALRA